jgi:hypothetical protein
MTNEGKAGCGCLFFILIVAMVAAGVLMHPLSLKFLGNQFKYEDKVFPADAIFVPRFLEDRGGELYVEAFREYGAGNGKVIVIEEERIFGVSLLELVQKMAKAKGLKNPAFRVINMPESPPDGAKSVKEYAEKEGFKKVIILVPEYASRRYHMLFGGFSEEGPVFMIKAVTVSYFKRDKWWKDSASRGLLLREVCSIGSDFARSFKYGSKGR